LWFAPCSTEPLSPLQRALGDDRTIEWLCNRAAAAMLIPRNEVQSLARDMPRLLHHVPVVAKHYLVPERLVARRLFHELSILTDFCVFAVRYSNDTRERGPSIAWSAMGPMVTRHKRKVAEGRIIPRALLPDVPLGQTCAVEIDGRWHLLVQDIANPSRAKALDRHPPMPPVPGWVARTRDTAYVALSHQNIAG
jgi:hypothetical protein